MIDENAIIESTMLGIEGHGIMTCFLNLNYGCSAQGFGGYSLGGAKGVEFLRKILETLEVETWEELKGVHCRVKASFLRRDGC